MRTEGDFIKITEWLLPLSWLYGIGVRFRNWMFDIGFLKSQSYDTPIISVGNITVGGSGKTPHVEYLAKLLRKTAKVAVLSRGYKRKTKGYVLANEHTTMPQIGDEPFQIHRKFSDIYVAVDKNRRRGIDHLEHDAETCDVEVILLDDAFQHRYVKPDVNILLIDYHRLIIYDRLLPAGRLREPKEGTSRANIVIITKCPVDLNPMEFRVLTRAMNLFPFQELFFTTIKYNDLTAVFGNDHRPISSITPDTNVLLLTGIASPQQMINDLQTTSKHITPLTFGDHHKFTRADEERINRKFEALPSPKIIITTEKDSTRLLQTKALNDKVKQNTYALTMEIKFLLDGEKEFDEKIIDYVRKNSRNSILAKRKNDNKA
jgi:tetraacyldisaccharide 4'-kinase